MVTMQKLKRHWLKILIMVVMFGGLYYWYNFKPTIFKAETSPFDTISCETEPEINEWLTYDGLDTADYSKLNADEIMSDMQNRKQINLYITCKDPGTDNYLNAYVFKNRKLILSRNLYRGYFFRTINDYFYTVQGIKNTKDPFYPLGYVLEKFQYNTEQNRMDLIETTEYKTREKLSDLYKFVKEHNYNFTSDPDFVTATLENEVENNNNKEINCACEKTFKYQYPVEWSGQVISTFSSGEDLGIKRSDQSGKYKQFYVDAKGMYKGDSGDFVRVRGKLIGTTCAYANTVFNECVGEVIADSIEKINN